MRSLQCKFGIDFNCCFPNREMTHIKLSKTVHHPSLFSWVNLGSRWGLPVLTGSLHPHKYRSKSHTHALSTGVWTTTHFSQNNYGYDYLSMAGIMSYWILWRTLAIARKQRWQTWCHINRCKIKDPRFCNLERLFFTAVTVIFSTVQSRQNSLLLLYFTSLEQP